MYCRKREEVELGGAEKNPTERRERRRMVEFGTFTTETERMKEGEKGHSAFGWKIERKERKNAGSATWHCSLASLSLCCIVGEEY